MHSKYTYLVSKLGERSDGERQCVVPLSQLPVTNFVNESVPEYRIFWQRSPLISIISHPADATEGYISLN